MTKNNKGASGKRSTAKKSPKKTPAKITKSTNALQKTKGGGTAKLAKVDKKGHKRFEIKNPGRAAFLDNADNDLKENSGNADADTQELVGH